MKTRDLALADAFTRFAELLRKTAPTPGRQVVKTYAAGAAKAVDGLSNTYDMPVTTAAMDRDHEVVIPRGLFVPQPKHLPLISSHDYRTLRHQIGDVLRFRADPQQGLARIVWFAGLGNDEADWGLTLVRLGVAAFSIGFYPVEWEEADLEDAKVLADVLAGKVPIRTYTKAELVEISQVVVPSNRGAVQQLAARGLLPAGVDVDRLAADLRAKGLPDVLPGAASGEEVVLVLADELPTCAVCGERHAAEGYVHQWAAEETRDDGTYCVTFTAADWPAAETYCEQHGLTLGGVIVATLRSGRLVATKDGKRDVSTLALRAADARAAPQETIEIADDPPAPAAKAADDLIEIDFDPSPAAGDEWYVIAAKQEERWRVGGARGLALVEDEEWDGAAAAAAIFRWAGADAQDAPASAWSRARRGFVVYNSADPQKRGSYKLPFALVRDGELVASRRGLQAARQRLSATSIPDDVKAAAGRFIDSYLGREEDGKAIPPVRGVAAIALADVAEADELELRDTDGAVVFRGPLWDLVDRAAWERTVVARSEIVVRHELPRVALDAAAAAEQLAAVIDKALSTAQERIAQTIDQKLAGVPILAADSAAHVTVKAITDHAIDAGAAAARQVVGELLGNVDAFLHVSGSRSR